MDSPSESRSSPFAPPGESLGRQVTPLDTWRAAALRSKQSMDAVSSAHANIDHCFVIIFSDLLSKYRRIRHGGLSLESGSACAVSPTWDRQAHSPSLPSTTMDQPRGVRPFYSTKARLSYPSPMVRLSPLPDQRELQELCVRASATRRWSRAVQRAIPDAFDIARRGT